ncbi:site-specific integrase [Marivirga harenae]|uniref:site-specific integrase n=1 Tax=Marivirga harenae TaxID=2010992 RepID=UPI0026DF557B|nr:site-specific integrase [Marivirga harenae]WKV11458.1 site-specific integrase [Marivirga harenae]
MFYTRSIQINKDLFLPLLFRDDTNQPCYIFLKFVLLDLRYKYSKTNIRNKLYCIKRLYQYSESRYQSFENLLIRGEKQPIQDIIDSFIYYILDSTSRYKQSVDYRNLILRSVNDFIEFINRDYNLEISLTKLRSFIIKSRTTLQRKNNRDIDSDFLLTVVHIASPSSEFNPFKEDEGIRIRNFVIVSLLQETGIRKGELLTLKIDSYQEFGDRFYIEIMDDPEEFDPRFSPPSVKNLQSNRTVAISKELFMVIHFYVITYRNVESNSVSKFLFLSEKGNPLGKNALANIIKKLVQKANEITNSNYNISPHDFRYAFANNFLSFLIDEKGYPLDKALDQLRAIMGWTLTSVMPSKYAANYISDKANFTNLKRIESFYENL